MAQRLKLLNLKKLTTYIHHRKGETKLGEKVRTLNESTPIEDQIAASQATYVFLGISEDIGIQANYGRAGARNSWEIGLKYLLNTQQNAFNKGGKLLIMGFLSFEEEYKKLNTFEKLDESNIKEVRKLVENIDKEVTYYVSLIVKAGKKPIVVGGGHNNAYGIIKGYSLAINRPIHAINLDAYSNFSAMEGRHSRNGFSYAFYEGFLKKYFILGLHENYTSKRIFKTFGLLSTEVAYVTFEDIEINKRTDFDTQLLRGLKFMGRQPFGVEVDCSAIAGITGSAITPSGFDVNQARRYMAICGKRNNAAYLHICGAAVSTDEATSEQLVGKFIAYLITDFIK